MHFFHARPPAEEISPLTAQTPSARTSEDKASPLFYQAMNLIQQLRNPLNFIDDDPILKGRGDESFEKLGSS
jgi:hypothetical protein